jgi:cytochrome c oxidase subunit 3
LCSVERGAQLQHQFDDIEQQRQADTLGMWAFLATETLFFGGVILAFSVYRLYYTKGFIEAAHRLHLGLGAINTAILLGSSFTVALAVHAASLGKKKRLVGLLLATGILGLAFLGVKFCEYWSEYREGLVPGLRFTYEGPFPAQVRLFFSFYFVMTALHAAHMVVGIAIFAVVAFQAWRGRYSPEYYSSVEVSGLYWHFVDIVWVFLFPLLYLLRG